MFMASFCPIFGHHVQSFRAFFPLAPFSLRAAGLCEQPFMATYFTLDSVCGIYLPAVETLAADQPKPMGCEAEFNFSYPGYLLKHLHPADAVNPFWTMLNPTVPYSCSGNCQWLSLEMTHAEAE